MSLDAGEEGGSVVTEPFLWEGERLLLNAVADDGEIAVEVLDADSRPVAGFGREDAIALTEDSARQAAAWREGSRLPDPAGGPIRLRFSLTGARLYSYWFE